MGRQWGLQEIINVCCTEEHIVFRNKRMPVGYPQQTRQSPAMKAAPQQELKGDRAAAAATGVQERTVGGSACVNDEKLTRGQSSACLKL